MQKILNYLNFQKKRVKIKKWNAKLLYQKNKGRVQDK